MNNKQPITSYVAQINNKQREKLYKILNDKGFEFTKIPYTHWKAKLGKFSIAAYESGKLVLQGKETHDFVLFTLEPYILHKAELGYENILNPKAEATKDNPFSPHIGIDESGKGDFFGPLVISAVFVDEQTAPRLENLGVKDSKLIKSDQKILDIAKKIRSTV